MKIYVDLPDEMVAVWCPVEAETVGADVYRIVKIKSDPGGYKVSLRYRSQSSVQANPDKGWKADNLSGLRTGHGLVGIWVGSFPKATISWIIDEDERVPDRLAIPFQLFRNTGCRDLNPASRRVRWLE